MSYLSYRTWQAHPQRGTGQFIRSYRLRQLQQVVNGANQAPFACHLSQAPKQELPKPAALFDLTKKRFGQRRAKAVAAASPGSPQFGLRRRHSGARTCPAPTRSAALVMALTSGGDITVYVVPGENGQITSEQYPASAENSRVAGRCSP